MAAPQVLVRLQKAEAYAAWKASGYALSELDEWCEENAAKYERTPEKLRAWIADDAANELSRAKSDAATDAQKVAKLVGATLPRALGALVEGLGAVRVKTLVDRNGKKTGEVESPDYQARLGYADKILQVLGAYAPEKVELFNGHLDEFTRLTDEELKRELAKYGKNKGTEVTAGGDGAKGGEGLPLLVTERDDHEGRAGRAEPLQAIPGSSLFSVNPRRTQ